MESDEGAQFDHHSAAVACSGCFRSRQLITALIKLLKIPAANNFDKYGSFWGQRLDGGVLNLFAHRYWRTYSLEPKHETVITSSNLHSFSFRAK